MSASYFDNPLLSRRQFLAGTVIAGISFCTGGCSMREALNIYNFSNYIGKNAIADFRKYTGIPVIYDEFSDQDTLFAKVKLKAGYDLVVCADYMLRRMLRQKLLAKIEGFRLKDQLMNRFAAPPWDPKLEYSVPYMWGTTGIGYNRKMVNPPPTKWADLWNPAYKNRITMLNAKRDLIGAALISLGLNGSSTDPRELAAAEKYLFEQKPIVRQYTCDYIDGLARDEIWLAQAWSGDVVRARQSNPDIDYCLPADGSFVFLDSWAIPEVAKHKEEAITFLNFIMQPRKIAEVTNTTGYPNAIQTSLPYVETQYINTPLGYPPKEMLQRTEFQADIGEAEVKWDKIWNELRFLSNAKD